jgi:flagellar assembly factor FliW
MTMTSSVVAAPEIEVRSAVLGTFRIAAAETITFPSGLPGFPGFQRYALVSGGSHGIFWLQSLENPLLVFVTIDPFAIAPEYSADIPDADARSLGAVDASDVALLAIVTLPRAAGERPTANLQAPVAVNFTTRLAKQVITGDAVHGVRWAFQFPVAA